jgi:iron(III) transport system ATP-binding protein
VRSTLVKTDAAIMSALKITDLWKSYAAVPVLRGVSLSVAPGSLTAILGASGAGKSTLLRIVAGFEEADGGTVALDGTLMDNGRRRVPPERRHTGYVPQDGALFPHLTVQANTAFALPRRSRHDAFVREMLDLVGLADLGARYPHELSGGQQQRVAIARALASRPRLVLLDEPFAALDASLRSAVRADVLGALRATGTAGVLVTHDQDEALSAADSVAVLRDGVVTQAGPPQTVYAVPADPWTAAFVGTANLLPGVTGSEPPGDVRVRTALGWHALCDSGHLGRGDSVSVLIRPEQITLHGPSGGPRSEAEAAVTGKVTDTRYHGHDALVTVDIPGAGPVRARTPGAAPLSPGDEVVLTIDGPVTAWPQAEDDQAVVASGDGLTGAEGERGATARSQ